MNKESPTGRQTTSAPNRQELNRPWVPSPNSRIAVGADFDAFGAAWVTTTELRAPTNDGPIGLVQADLAELEVLAAAAESGPNIKHGELGVYMGCRDGGKSDFWQNWHSAIQRRQEGHRAIIRAIREFLGK